MTALYLGFVFGFLGSLHCIGMCGPIALSIPHKREGQLGIAFDNLLYNIGRVLTYTILGVIVGYLGQKISLAGYQEGLSIALGIILILYLIIPQRYRLKITSIPVFASISAAYRKVFGSVLQSKSSSSVMTVGILNGFLPCGFVYMALAPAAAYGNIFESALFMAGFGFGTIPAMFSVFQARHLITVNIRRKINKLLPYGVAVVAVLLIVRGMSLGIPYISPKLKASVHQNIEEPDCCH